MTVSKYGISEIFFVSLEIPLRVFLPATNQEGDEEHLNVIIVAKSQVNCFLFQRHRRVTRIESY